MGFLDGFLQSAQNVNAPPQALNPNANTVGGRTGIAAYNGIGIAPYKDPYDVDAFKNSKYYGIATGDQQTPWSKLAVKQQGELAAQQNSSAKAQANGAAATAATHLAQQGGLTSGARERVAEDAGKNVLSMTQGNNQTSGNNIANIGIEDAKQRQAMLGDATGKLTSMTAGNIQGQNQYNQSVTDQLNKAVGANQTSEAQQQAEWNKAHSGLFSGGGFMGLGI